MATVLTAMRQRIDHWLGGSVERDLTPYRKILAEIERHGTDFGTRPGKTQSGEAGIGGLSDEGIQDRSARLKSRAVSGEPLDDLLVESYTLVREASRRTLGLDPFDVQILAGIAMHRGKLAEMQTGEGKTLVAVFPATLNALTGRGVHVLTFNDYLARRDAGWMGPIYRCLGLTVGFVQEGMDRRQRQEAYACDVTYVTAKEAGFDFLQGFLCNDERKIVHRPFHLAIVDEADSILIDEARNPLVIAGSRDAPAEELHQMDELARRLQAGLDYLVDENGRNLELTEEGLERTEATLGRGSLHAPENLHLLTELNCALHVHALLRQDVDYILRDGKVWLVDEFTGRVVEDRHWPDGLQAALESKEGVRRQPGGQILGSISIPHFLRSYPKICGMTATARTAAQELAERYGLDVVVIPPHRSCIRTDHPDVLFTHKAAKRRALVKEIQCVHATRRPVLVGTASVEESDHLAEDLRRSGIECEVLNARTDELEARIIAGAGSLDAVTISTNMAGRGTDIRLGGEHEEDREAVVALGGLYVIGTNRHESLRIDRQLRGRAGRQGDPGSSRFFISLEDDLIERYGIRHLIPPKLLPERQDEPLENPIIRREIARAQRIIEGQNSEIRRTLWDYSSLIEEQRRMLHEWRQEILCGRAPGSLLEERSPERWRTLRAGVSNEVLRRVERVITLFHIDRCWSEHLARVADLREGIHLRRVAGRDPLEEFGRLAAGSFHEMRAEIEEAVVETFESAEIDAGGIDLEREGLRGPASTWTYLVSDDPLRVELSSVLASNIAFAAGAALTVGPLIIAWGIYNRYFRKRATSR